MMKKLMMVTAAVMMMSSSVFAVKVPLDPANADAAKNCVEMYGGTVSGTHPRQSCTYGLAGSQGGNIDSADAYDSSIKKPKKKRVRKLKIPKGTF